MGFAAGAYRWFANGLPLGIVEDSPRLRVKNMGTPIKADAAGGMDVNYIGAGKEATLDIVFAEFVNDGVQALLSTLGAVPAAYQAVGNQPPGYQMGAVNAVGCPTLSGTGAAVILHAVALGSCATPASFIARMAAIPINYDVELLMGSKLRNVPLRLKLHPYLYPNTGSNQYWRCFEFHATAPAPDATSGTAFTSLQTYLNTALS